MPWGYAAAAVGSALVSNAGSRSASRQQANAARDAAELNLQAQRESIAAQREAMSRSLAEQQRQFDTTREDWQPWRQTGMSALERLQGLMDFDPTPTAESVMAEPGYQFGLTQGRDILEGSAAARGGLYSGQALRELTRFGNDYATTRFGDSWNRQQAAFGNRFGRLSSMAGLGQSATQQVSNAGMNFANNATNLYGNNANMTGSLLMGTAGNLANIGMSNANAQAAARMNQANIWGNALGQLGGLYGSGAWGNSRGGSPGVSPGGYTGFEFGGP